MSVAIESIATEKRLFPPSAAFREHAIVRDFTTYQKLYEQSIEDPEHFWGTIAENFQWFKKWAHVSSGDFKSPLDIRWFEGGQTNLSVNCLDRQVKAGKGERAAFIWEGNEPGENRTLTYRQLLKEVCRLGNALRELGIRKGDRVAIYMPMIPELPIALLACARIGAIHTVIFGGFSPESIKDRILDATCRLVITTDGLKRGPKQLSLKDTIDRALELCKKNGHEVAHCIVYRHTDTPISMRQGRDHWWHEITSTMPEFCEPAVMDAEDPLFILYTSGSTGKPKGVLHTTAGYMVYAATTFKYVFDHRDSDIFWCTADIGWVTGHSYIVYGPLLNAATCVLFEGIPTYPNAGRFWDVIDRNRVTVFYTAPTAIRALAREGEAWPQKYSLKSLRLLGSVGEPINPEAWMWFHTHIGHRHCPIVDTWWQTETGGILMTTLPGAVAAKPGAAGFPFFGVQAKILREDGSEATANEGGTLVIEAPWPGIMRGVYGDPARFEQTYFSQFPGHFLTGDICHRDEDGYYGFMGRSDDIIKVSGHRLGTAEIESALVSHPGVAEAAVVGFPHDIKGQGIYAYVTPKEGIRADESLRKTLVAHVRGEIGAIATPDVVHFANALPKTRSGKIMRRILRKIAAGEIENLGDTSTLADPSVVEMLLQNK